MFVDWFVICGGALGLLLLCCLLGGLAEDVEADDFGRFGT